MKYDLTSNLIFFRPVMKLKYIDNYKAVFDFKQMGLFLICQGMWALGGLSDIIGRESSYYFSTPRQFFVGFFFCWNNKKSLIWYKVYILRTIHVDKCRSDYWCVTWVENPPPANCGLVVPIVVSYVHQKSNRRCLMNI